MKITKLLNKFSDLVELKLQNKKILYEVKIMKNDFAYMNGKSL